MTHGDREYRIVMGSDVLRDGMFIEVRTGPEGADTILEVFHSDVSQDMVVSLFVEALPVEVVDWAISVARVRLPSRPDGAA